MISEASRVLAAHPKDKTLLGFVAGEKSIVEDETTFDSTRSRARSTLSSSADSLLNTTLSSSAEEFGFLVPIGN